jgi:hypothetical protein
MESSYTLHQIKNYLREKHKRFFQWNEWVRLVFLILLVVFGLSMTQLQEWNPYPDWYRYVFGGVTLLGLLGYFGYQFWKDYKGIPPSDHPNPKARIAILGGLTLVFVVVVLANRQDTVGLLAVILITGLMGVRIYLLLRQSNNAPRFTQEKAIKEYFQRTMRRWGLLMLLVLLLAVFYFWQSTQDYTIHYPILYRLGLMELWILSEVIFLVRLQKKEGIAQRKS